MANSIYSEKFIGTVMAIDKKTRKIGVYIPRLMPGIDGGEAMSYRVPTNAGLEISNITTNISTIVTKNNYIWVPGIDYNEPLPKIGSKVFINYIDNNPSLAYWTKFNINNDYEIIDDEKYNKLFNLQIGNQSLNIKENDNVIIDLPNYLQVMNIPTENEKEMHFKINENFHFYLPLTLEESIVKLQKSISFLESEYQNTFIKSIEKLKLNENADSYNLLIQNKFNEFKQNFINKVQESEDLSSSKELFDYYFSLLSGLIEAYNKYLVYLEKYKAFTKKEIIPNITEHSIQNKILNFFNNAEILTNEKNVNKYIDYITNEFSSVIHFVLNYNDANGVKQQREILENIFDTIQTDINQEDTSNESIPKFIISETQTLNMTPALPANNQAMMAVLSNFQFYSFDDTMGNTLFWYRPNKNIPNFVVNPNYYAISDMNVFAKFYGEYFYLTDQDQLQINYFNDTKLKLKSNETTDGFTIVINIENYPTAITCYTLEEANNKLKDLKLIPNIQNILSITATMNLISDNPSEKIPSLVLKYQKKI